mmetsp:Transcript_12654/g.34905  ORF Transcript_12654/g.34905 Transcript_12654/m.34905 type:complete len:326 (+) Transcript_12654:304-1281(+)
MSSCSPLRRGEKQLLQTCRGALVPTVKTVFARLVRCAGCLVLDGVYMIQALQDLVLVCLFPRWLLLKNALRRCRCKDTAAWKAAWVGAAGMAGTPVGSGCGTGCGLCDGGCGSRGEHEPLDESDGIAAVVHAVGSLLEQVLVRDAVGHAGDGLLGHGRAHAHVHAGESAGAAAEAEVGQSGAAALAAAASLVDVRRPRWGCGCCCVGGHGVHVHGHVGVPAAVVPDGDVAADAHALVVDGALVQGQVPAAVEPAAASAEPLAVWRRAPSACACCSSAHSGRRATGGCCGAAGVRAPLLPQILRRTGRPRRRPGMRQPLRSGCQSA